MRIAITGASGNVGTALLRRLAETGDHEVVGLARRPPGSGPVAEAARWTAVDLTDPLSASVLAGAFAGADAVVHLAWGFQPSHKTGYLEELGVGGTRRVLEAVAQAGVPHVVHMSSVGAYSPKRDDRPVDEIWPTGGVRSSWYSRAKAAAERLLDSHEAEHDTTVTRMRPGIVGQSQAGSSLMRYGVPALIPRAALDWLPVLPLDRRLAVPMVHADDVADAVVRALERRASGAFNLAAEPPVTAERIAEALGARLVDVPRAAVRAAVTVSWHARLQKVDPGWIDLGYAVPLLDTSRAQQELGWSPSVDAIGVLEETLAGMRHGASGSTAVLRLRSVPGELRRLVRRGPVSERRLP